ncbi:MAG: Type secretion system protein [Patescibacteria group bacterium]|jgi:type II secretory pathway pseudopilin PulG|nr:Type secretion system protein [Patescibacteria group bacterium]
MVLSNIKKTLFKLRLLSDYKGFSLVEILLAVGIFALFGTIMLSAFVYGREGVRLAGDRSRATELANGGIEVVRNIANPSYSNLSSFSNGTNYYITSVNNRWQLTIIPQTIDNKYTRIVNFSDGPNGSRKVTVTVNWAQNFTRSGTLSANTYFANWRQPTSSPIKSGLFVYADGGTSTDRLEYRQLLTTGSWTPETVMPDVSTTSSNRVPRSLKLYSAQTGSAKMMLSRHYDGTRQYMYATAWNGTSWATPELLAQWTSSSALNSGNYGGEFLADGSFVAVYSDGSNVPKSRSFNGAVWGPQVGLGAIGSSNNYITAMMIRARPNSNDMMAVFLTSNYQVNTSFYTNSSWSAYTLHTNSSAGNGSLLVDFDWSNTNTNQGVVLYTNSSNDRALRAQTFTTNGGLGSWGPVMTSGNINSGQEIISLRQIARPNNSNELISCAKSYNSPGFIYCFELNPDTGFTTPINNIITNNTDYGGQITFDVAYKYDNSNDGVIAYSDNTRSGKLKIYNSSLNTWVSNAISLNNASSNIGKTRIVGRPNSDETMVMVSDSFRNLYSVVLDGTTNTLFTSPSGKAWTNHLSTGPTNDAVWFDFAWDN